MKLNLVQIQTTSRCNGWCIICPYKDSWFKKNPGQMSDEPYTKILNDIITYDPEFSGKFCPYLCNEPFADKNILARIEQAINILKNPFLEISTNLSLVTNKQIDRLVDLYADNQWKGRVMVSHHGLTKDAYERIMGIKHGLALEKLKYLLKKADKKLSVWIHSASQSRDEKYFMTSSIEVKRYWMEFLVENDLPLNNVYIYPLQFHSRAGNVQLKDWKYEKSLRKFKGCPRVRGQLHVIYTGEVVLCCCDYQRATVFGDLTKQSIKEVFSSDKWKEYKGIVEGEIVAPAEFLCNYCQHPGA